MKTVLAAAVVAVAILTAPQAAAQAAPSAQQLRLAEDLMVVMQLDKQIERMVEQMRPVMFEQFRKTAPNLPADKAQLLADSFSEAMPGFMNQMKAGMVPVYAATFSEQELRDIIAFYKTPSGQLFVEKGPTLATKMSPLIVDLMPNMMKDVITRFCSKTDCSTLPKPPPRT